LKSNCFILDQITITLKLRAHDDNQSLYSYERLRDELRYSLRLAWCRRRYQIGFTYFLKQIGTYIDLIFWRLKNLVVMVMSYE